MQGSSPVTIKPMQPAPELDVATLDGRRFRLADRRPKAFTLVLFYRGLHCPICKQYLRELDRKLDDFAPRGVDVIAVSTDSEERAARSKEEWELARLPIGYGGDVKSCVSGRRGWRGPGCGSRG
jgi:peroxiredoxin